MHPSIWKLISLLMRKKFQQKRKSATLNKETINKQKKKKMSTIINDKPFKTSAFPSTVTNQLFMQNGPESIHIFKVSKYFIYHKSFFYFVF